MDIFIYKLIDPITEEIRYIGKTNNPKNRLNSHIYRAKTSDSVQHVLFWIKSLINKGFKPQMEVIETCCQETWSDREIYWIAKHKEMGCRLCNHQKGGGSCLTPLQVSKKKKSMSDLFSKYDVPTKRDIWSKIQEGWSLKDIQKVYSDFTRHIYYQVSSGRVWRDITNLVEVKPCTKLHPRSSFSKQDILDIRDMYNSGKTTRYIADLYLSLIHI